MMAVQPVGPWAFFSVVVGLPILNFNLLTIHFPSWLCFTDYLKAVPAGLRFKNTGQQSGEVGHLDLISRCLVVSIS